MKTKIIVVAFGIVAAALLRAGEANPAPCCPAEKPAVPAPCCPEEKPAAPLTARSLYQLDAKFTDDADRTVMLAALRGQPVIAAMFFASCEYACPMLVADVQRVRAGLAPDVRAKARVVLVTFDVARDTPAALRAYRERANLDANVTLLRGDAAAVQELAMLLGVKYQQDARGQFAHSNLITILNAEGEITHQKAGLLGDVSEAARAVTLAAK